jgi:glucokinase
MFNIGIDVGGSNIKAGLVGENNQILHSVSIPTRNINGETLISDLESVANELISKQGITSENINSIGVCCPGWIQNGILHHANNLDNCDETNIANDLKARINIPVYVDNDAQIAAIAEWEARAEKVAMFYVIVGTGIGGGFINEHGSLFTSNNNVCLEIGHMITHYHDENARQCTCGKKGCFEAHASTISLKKIAQEKFPEYPWTTNGKEIYDAARAGNPDAMSLISLQIEELALGISNACLILDPQLVVIGGAMSKDFDMIEEELTKKLKALEYSPKLSRRIERALLINNGGILGASALWKQYS